jgi:hypothetical protein
MTRRRSALLLARPTDRARRAQALRARALGDDTGAATAEYAVVTVAAAGLGGILIKLLTSDWFQDILRTILETIIRAALSFFGIG